MPTTNARGHVIPTGAEQSIKRATIFETFANSIRDIATVATTTARTQLVNALTAVSQGPATTRPLTVYRADAPGMHRIETTVNGTLFLPLSGVPTFTTKALADSFATANGGLLSIGDECIAAGLRYRWSGTLWYLPFASARASAGTNAQGIVQVTHGMGKAPAGVTAVIAMDSPVIGGSLKAEVGEVTATTFQVRVRRGDQGWAVFAENPVVFYWTAVA